jgi:hypothetical protein
MDIVKKLELIAKGFEAERVTDAQAKSAVPVLIEAIKEIRGLWAFKNSVGEALNRGDGSYRP